MAKNNPRPPQVTVSVDAVTDLTLIYIQTAETWDQEQAERYNEFLSMTDSKLCVYFTPP